MLLEYEAFFENNFKFFHIISKIFKRLTSEKSIRSLDSKCVGSLHNLCQQYRSDTTLTQPKTPVVSRAKKETETNSRDH